MRDVKEDIQLYELEHDLNGQDAAIPDFKCLTKWNFNWPDESHVFEHELIAQVKIQSSTHSLEENEIPTDEDDSARLQRKILEDLRKLDCSENVDEEAVEQWINEDSTLECCKVLSDDDIVSHVTCGSEETRNFEEHPESDEENLTTHQKLSHGDALLHIEALLNYLEQEMKAHLHKK
ncbi:hypothetical protein AVEN_7416-1 [Araneus ventricosus]|uniref:Jerky-like n=1 Tax=Araneus ventricosus TaxID=182803 RepID=A0A4Y2H1Q6_ARAVE|nr:hypothetical protein AVEN_7416-1 [Araneus ventricosus]